MASFNKVVLMGNLTRAPELRYAKSSDMALVNGAIAVNETVKGEKKATYWDFTAFGKTAEAIGKYCDKGSCILIEGKLDKEEWEKDGVKREKAKVIVQNMQIVTFKDDKGNATPAKSSSRYDDDDLPF